jgi:uncharacterized membrane protein
MRVVAMIFGVFYFMLICCLLCAGVVLITEHKGNKDRRIELIKKVKAIPYGNLVFQEGRECAICWE